MYVLQRIKTTWEFIVCICMISVGIQYLEGQNIKFLSGMISIHFLHPIKCGLLYCYFCDLNWQFLVSTMQSVVGFVGKKKVSQGKWSWISSSYRWKLLFSWSNFAESAAHSVNGFFRLFLYVNVFLMLGGWGICILSLFAYLTFSIVSHDSAE